MALMAACLLAAGAMAAGKTSGTVRIDGSSTVAPITTATAELFRMEQPKVRVTVGVSGTGGGFKKFLDESPELRTDINDASRPISAKELERARSLGVEFYEIPVGLDGIAVVVNPTNKFVDHLTVEELRRIWEPGSKIDNWSEVRPGFPELPLRLYGPGADSGTFDYFTEVITGRPKASRSDYTASESDNVLVQGVSGDPGALGYFGFAYYEVNHDKLRAIPVAEEGGTPVMPDRDTIRSGAYKPLARPIFLYVNKQSFERNPAVAEFARFLLNKAPTIVEHPRVGYVALSDAMYRLNLERIEQGKSGSVMAEHGTGHVSDLLELYGGR